MPNRVILTLLLVVLVSALYVIKVRHQHRVAYMAYQAQVSMRDSLNDEWGQLLVEENVWASSHRIEKHAGEQLSMRAPVKDEVQIVGGGAASQIAGVDDGSR